MVFTPKSILVTGGAGFIGSHMVNLLREEMSQCPLVVLDRLDYCSRPKNWKYPVNLVRGDIRDTSLVKEILTKYEIDTILHFAAQTHVDNSFLNSNMFIEDNVVGTHNLLMACDQRIKLFLHVSTDEVYGETLHGSCREDDVMNPTNPYAAAKAAAEHIVRSFGYSYHIPYIITRGNNVYGPGQHVEKLIPRFSCLLYRGKKLTIHGQGLSRRNFLYVEDTCRAFLQIIKHGKINETYNIGSNNEFSVMEIARKILNLVVSPQADLSDYTIYVTDRNFNDQRYHLNSDKLKQLGWREQVPFDQGLRETVEWYARHLDEYQIE